MMGSSPGMPKSAIAKQFGIARSTLYRTPTKQAEKDKRNLDLILEIMRSNPHYGKPRIADGLGRDIKLVKRIMEKYGLKPKKRKKRFRKPKDERRDASDIPNRIKDICPIAPDAIWVGDFTYMDFYDRFVYLATVLDRFTREVVGWSLGLHHSTQLVIDALEDAVRKRGPPDIFHSDQGSEYDSLACRAWLMAHEILPSHSHKSSPWENGHQESFFGRFKEEFGNVHRFKSLDELVEAIHHQIHYYNTKRIHRALRMSPLQKYEQTMLLRNLALETQEKQRSESVA